MYLVSVSLSFYLYVPVHHQLFYLFLLSRASFWRRFPRIHLPIHAAVCTLCFAFALPVAIALFPQESKVIITCSRVHSNSPSGNHSTYALLYLVFTQLFLQSLQQPFNLCPIISGVHSYSYSPCSSHSTYALLYLVFTQLFLTVPLAAIPPMPYYIQCSLSYS